MEVSVAATCDWCGREMIKGLGTCTGNETVKYPDGPNLNSVPYDHGKDGNCHDCGIRNGGKHHPGCDMERCPKCSGQLISCGCLNEEEE